MPKWTQGKGEWKHLAYDAETGILWCWNEKENCWKHQDVRLEDGYVVFTAKYGKKHRVNDFVRTVFNILPTMPWHDRVDHRDGNRQDNRYINLMSTTAHGNAVRIAIVAEFESDGRTIEFQSLEEAAECANVSPNTISDNLCGRRKRTKWKAPGEFEGQWFRVKRQRLDTDV